ncbi:MAG: hypothetical protein LBJ25_04560 [Candidatus Margulisbacteria bacterium]|jgi:endo-1,4-beta-D-glucanase Y|nr:hypothetical protein [Candidatus Margulisiibacteriota bacterium]
MCEEIKTIGAYQTYAARITGGTAAAASTQARVTGRYAELFGKYALRTPNGIFIKDPSQNNQIVSEGQAYWQALSADLARINPAQARTYQDNFDGLLKGTQHMIKLAKDSGNRGEFPAWKVKATGSSVTLDRDSYGPTANSAADADLDIVRSLIYAQDLVERGVWTDRGYAKLLDTLLPAAQNLFRDQGGIRVLRPSEDWDGFHFTDYLDPAAYKEIAQYLTKRGQTSAAAFWEKAAVDSMKLYAEALNDTGTFPANINIKVHSASDIAVSAANNTNMSYDGIRAPWRIARYIIMFAENNAEAQAAKNALALGSRNRFSHTYGREMDAAMYLPLSIALGDTASSDLSGRIFNGSIDSNKYFENTLELLGLVDAVFPHQVDINASAASSAPAPAAPTPVSPVRQPAQAAGRAPVNLPSSISSGWSKNVTYKVTSPNILSVQGKQHDDNDLIGLARNVPLNGAQNLQVKVRSISGNFHWGIVFGLSLDGKWAEPEETSINRDGFVNGNLRAGDILTFPLKGSSLNSVEMKLYSGANFELEFWLE